jgi:hypothetical protein
LGKLVRVGGVGLAMGLFVAWAQPHLLSWLGESLPGRITALAAAIGLGMGLYWLGIAWAGIPEYQDLYRGLAAKIRRG